MYGSADEHMAKTNDLRPRLGLIGGQEEHQRPLNTSVIGADMRVFSTSVVSVAGTVLGSVSADDQVIVTKGGRVEGGVEAREVVLNGEVRGPVDARERLEIQASAMVHGDLHAPRLRLLEGAVVDGDVSIAESSMECQSGAASGSAPQAPGIRGGDGSSGDAAVLKRDGTAPERRVWVKPMSIVPGGMIALVVGWLISSSPSPGPAPNNPTTPVEAAVEPQISLFRASSTSITLGDEVTLIWNTSLADSVHLLPGEGTVAASGSTALSPEQDTEYVLVAYGPGGEARDPIQITVAVQLDAPTIEEFSADRTTVTQGDEVTLTWNTSDADRVELEPGGPVALSGDTNVSPGATVNYALVASGPGGETRQSVRINVAAPIPDPPIASLTAQPNTIERGGTSTLTSELCSDDGPVTAVPNFEDGNLWAGDQGCPVDRRCGGTHLRPSTGADGSDGPERRDRKSRGDSESHRPDDPLPRWQLDHRDQRPEWTHRPGRPPPRRKCESHRHSTPARQHGFRRGRHR